MVSLTVPHKPPVGGRGNTIARIWSNYAEVTPSEESGTYGLVDESLKPTTARTLLIGFPPEYVVELQGPTNYSKPYVINETNKILWMHNILLIRQCLCIVR
jgi:hypothetical protein